METIGQHHISSQLLRRSNQWSRDTFIQHQMKAQIELEQRFAENHKKRVQFAIERIEELMEQPSQENQLISFVHVLEAIRSLSKTSNPKVETINQYVDYAHSILKLQCIHQSKSRLSFLHSEVKNLEAQALARIGRQFSAAWTSIESLRSLRRQHSKNPDQGITTIRSVIRLGSIQYAKQLLDKHFARSLTNHYPVAYLRAKCSLLEGNLDLARTQLAELAATTVRSRSLQIDWDLLIIEALENKCSRPLQRAIKKGKPHYAPNFILEALLISFALNDKNHNFSRYDVSKLRRRKGINFKDQFHLKKVIQIFQTHYSEETNNDGEFFAGEQLLNAYLNRNKMPTIEQELFLTAAMFNLLKNNRRQDLSNLLLADYDALSLKLTSGRTRRIFNLLENK